MKIRIKKQHLAGADYLNNYDCPFARALRSLGYVAVDVRGYLADATRDRKRYQFRFTFGPADIENAQREGNKPFTVNVIRSPYE